MAKYKMSEYTACAAQIRPTYCKMEANYCCLWCVHIKDCEKLATKEKLIRPCTLELFDEEEICEFAV